MRAYRIGIDVGGTKIAYGLFDEKNELIDQLREPTDAEIDGPSLADQILKQIEVLLERNQLEQKDLKGIGICMPSFILFDEGYICMTSAMTNVRDFAMREYMARRLSVPIVLDNDSNCAALAEYRFGAGRGSRHMIYMAASTGIGSGLILNGEVFRGSYGWAGESGHMLITPDEGILCGCRNQGCFMSWAGGRYIPERVRQKADSFNTCMDLSRDIDGVALLQACREEDPLALAVLDQMAHYLAVCVFNVYQMLNVNLFVFGGGLTHFGPLLFDRVRTEFDRYNHIPQLVEFRFAELKQDFGMIGAAELVK
ncbi:MAG: ROK family protein [Oscillospiraceae bacterium]|nr:ROK family protein [Oscillospiraceae bacterium]